MTAGAGKARGSPFNPRVVLALLLFGALAFIATLYFVGAGATGDDGSDSGSHAASKGLTGYAALVQLLDKRGYDVSISRTKARLDDRALLVLTPQLFADGEDIARLVAARKYQGPTILILPKWFSYRLPENVRKLTRTPKGWVVLAGPHPAEWAEDMLGKPRLAVALDKRKAASWSGLELGGKLPEPGAVQSVSANELVPLVRDDQGKVLAAYRNDGGSYTELAAWAGAPVPVANADGDAAPGNVQADRSAWPLVIVAEPDLLDNYGMADRDRAQLALRLVDGALDGEDLPVVFDLTAAGISSGRNLLTLAFEPPFLAATLCLILAALVAAWRAFRRFGPPVAELPPIAFGKRQLARNTGSLIQRSRRLHLLAAPYAALLRGRIAQLLGLRHSDDAARIEAEIDRILARRMPDEPPFSTRAAALRNARRPAELLRGAAALKELERKLAP